VVPATARRLKADTQISAPMSPVKTGRPIYSGLPEEILQVFAVAGKADGTDIGTWNGLEKCFAKN
jgi:hypothetical protein